MQSLEEVCEQWAEFLYEVYQKRKRREQAVEDTVNLAGREKDDRD